MHIIARTCSIILLSALSLTKVSAQTAADSVYNKYTDMSMAKLQGNTAGALALALQILPNVNKLPQKNQLPFYNTLAKLYEDSGQINLATPLYERVLANQPNYYVAHLALGHIYLRDADALAAKANAAQGNKAEYEKLKAAYIAKVNKILPHLEKVQACDPYDENLQLITKLYTAIGKPEALKTLNKRVKEMSSKCVDILDER